MWSKRLSGLFRPKVRGHALPTKVRMSRPGCAGEDLPRHPGRRPDSLFARCQERIQRHLEVHRLTRSNPPNRLPVPANAIGVMVSLTTPHDYALRADVYGAAPIQRQNYRRCPAIAIPSRSRRLIIVHAYYEQEAEQIFSLLKAYPGFDIILTTSVDTIAESFLRQFDASCSACLRVPNIGRDILPFLAVSQFLFLDKYTHFIKVHTKRSVHLNEGERWLERNLHTLLPGIKFTETQFALMDTETPSIYGASLLPIQDHYRNNRRWLTYLLGHSPWESNACFIPGSMFVGTGEFLKRVREFDLLRYRMEPERGQLDGCLGHAVERMFGYIAERCGGECAVLPHIVLDRREPSHHRVKAKLVSR